MMVVGSSTWGERGILNSTTLEPFILPIFHLWSFLCICSNSKFTLDIQCSVCLSIHVDRAIASQNKIQAGSQDRQIVKRLTHIGNTGYWILSCLSQSFVYITSQYICIKCCDSIPNLIRQSLFIDGKWQFNLYEKMFPLINIIYLDSNIVE